MPPEARQGRPSRFAHPEGTGVIASARRTGRLVSVAATLLLLLAFAALADDQDRVRWQGEMRNIAVYAPTTRPGPAPLLLVLGQPGRSARYALGSWKETADLEGFVVAAVSSLRPNEWRTPHDGPGLLRAVVQRVRARREIDTRRIYLFGSGTGSGFVLMMGRLQPRYFAAVASFGEPPQVALPGDSKLGRALPVRIFYSKRMLQFDVDALREAAADLRGAGADVEIGRLDVSTDFERKGRKVAGRIWAALEEHALGEPPRYRSTPYDR